MPIVFGIVILLIIVLYVIFTIDNRNDGVLIKKAVMTNTLIST